MNKIVLILLFLAGCGVLNKVEDFTVYKESIVEVRRQIPLRIDGVYLTIDDKALPMVFYKNGYFKRIVQWHDSSVWKNPDKFLDIALSKPGLNVGEGWGQYKLFHDTIVSQRFNKFGEGIYKRWVFEDSLKILNDTTLKLFSTHTYWGKYPNKSPVIFRFFPTDSKPDSTKAWFRDKNWFKKGLHESRKP